MKTKLIQTKDYLLLIDEEAEIKDMNYFIRDTPPMNFKTKRFIKKRDVLSPTTKSNKIIAYYPLTKEAKELDLPLLPNPFEEDKYIKDLAQQRWGNVHRTGVLGFIEGYKAAQQSKQFSLEDIKKAIVFGVENAPTIETHTKMLSNKDYRYFVLEELINKYVQSLSTQQLPKEFIPEYIGGGEYLAGQIGDNEIWAEYPKELETITNSEGKEELIGTYKH